MTVPSIIPATSLIIFPMAAAQSVDIPNITPKLVSMASPAIIKMALSQIPNPIKGMDCVMTIKRRVLKSGSGTNSVGGGVGDVVVVVVLSVRLRRVVRGGRPCCCRIGRDFGRHRLEEDDNDHSEADGGRWRKIFRWPLLMPWWCLLILWWRWSHEEWVGLCVFIHSLLPPFACNLPSCICRCWRIETPPCRLQDDNIVFSAVKE